MICGREGGRNRDLERSWQLSGYLDTHRVIYILFIDYIYVHDDSQFKDEVLENKFKCDCTK